MPVGTGLSLQTAGQFIGVVLLAVILVVALALFTLRAASRRRGREHHAGRGQGASADEEAITAALSTRASAALVAIDDAIRTSGQELAFAQAQFGQQATATFDVALREARTSVARAFALRQQLDDAFPESEPQARAMAAEILRICAQVTAELDSRAHEFDELRDLHARAPELLDDVRRDVAEVEARIPTARLTLEALSASYPAAALASVSGNPDQVERLAAGIALTLAAGRSALEKGDRGAAVAAARSGEAGLAQASHLLDAVEHAAENLTEARHQLTTRIAALSQTVIDAARLAPSDPEVDAQVAAATALISESREAGTSKDPIATLNAVNQVQGVLSSQLAPYRARSEQAEAAQKQLVELLAHTNAQIGAVGTYIDSRRGAVGPEARTRLSEAARHAQQAQEAALVHPVQALSEATEASQLVGSAQILAQQDVADFEGQQYRGPRGSSGGAPGGPAGMVLGGIVIEQLLRGGRRGFRGGFRGGGC